MSQHHTAPTADTDNPDGFDSPDRIWHTPRHTPRWMLRDAYGTPSTATTVALAVFALLMLIVLVCAVGPYVLHAAQWIAQPEHSTVPAGRLWRTISTPIHHYLQAHCAGLPAGPRTLYTAWAIAASSS
ncbi:hypothetical protein ACFQ1I_46910 [Kitasatospora arboriphila]